MSALMHHHACPECHELPACTDDCTIEPDLGTTPGGYPKAHPIVCRACERARLTSSEVALAKVLVALEEWDPTALESESDKAIARYLFACCDAAPSEYFDGALAPWGRALLDRARKAGVL